MSARFWSKVDKSGECWEWTAGRFPNGYGCFWADGKSRKAHRVAYELERGPIPEWMQIDHQCHNTLCVNPDHLRVVTGKQNCENVRGAQSNSSSKVRGVTWVKRDRRWIGRVVHNMSTVHVGSFRSLEEAEAAVIAKRNELFTHNDADRGIGMKAMVLEDCDWMADAHNKLVEVAAKGESFTAYSLTQAGLREPPTPHMWGTLFREAARLGHIRRAWPNYIPSPRPARKGGVCAQWKAAA